jgi:serine/arginine repetitive matrix protein 2
VTYNTSEEMAKLDNMLVKQPNKEILDHNKKRKIEVRCMELREKMEEQGYSDDEIESKVQDLRESLLSREMPCSKGKDM